MEYRTLIKPLSEKEHEQLLRLETLHAEGQELNPEQGEALAELWMRQNRQADLEAFRIRYESKYFGESEEESIEPEHMKVFNYPAKVECYKQKRQHHTTAQSIRQLIAIERKAQPEQREQAMRSANLRGDRDQMEIKFDLIERVYDAYEQFLRQELEMLEAPQPVANTTILKSTPLTQEFGDYLKEDYQEKLLPFLKEHYTGFKAKPLTCMLFALADLGLLNITLENTNKTALYESLDYFGYTGTRQALTTSINNYSRASEREHNRIEGHRKRIKAHLDSA